MDDILELVLSARHGSDYAFSQICVRYSALLNSLSQKYSDICVDEQGERDDFLQESKIALYNAVLTYNAEKQNITFGAYAKVCIRNRLISYLRKCKSKKRQSKELVATPFEEKTASERVAWQEFEQQLAEQMEDNLSDFEKEIFKMLYSEMSIKEISKMTNKSEKSVNNAIYRARRKLKGMLNEKIT